MSVDRPRKCTSTNLLYSPLPPSGQGMSQWHLGCGVLLQRKRESQSLPVKAAPMPSRPATPRPSPFLLHIISVSQTTAAGARPMPLLHLLRPPKTHHGSLGHQTPKRGPRHPGTTRQDRAVAMTRHQPGGVAPGQCRKHLQGSLQRGCTPAPHPPAPALGLFLAAPLVGLHLPQPCYLLPRPVLGLRSTPIATVTKRIITAIIVVVVVIIRKIISTLGGTTLPQSPALLPVSPAAAMPAAARASGTTCPVQLKGA